jgi:hypothetical protein
MQDARCCALLPFLSVSPEGIVIHDIANLVVNIQKRNKRQFSCLFTNSKFQNHFNILLAAKMYKGMTQIKKFNLFNFGIHIFIELNYKARAGVK